MSSTLALCDSDGSVLNLLGALMKTILLVVSSLLLTFSAHAVPMTYVSQPSLFHYFSPIKKSSLDVNGSFTATYTFDTETLKGHGKLNITYDLGKVGEGKKVTLKNLALVCREMDRTIPTVVTKGDVICETLVPVIRDEIFFTTFQAYSGTLPTHMFHGNTNGRLLMSPEVKQRFCENPRAFLKNNIQAVLYHATCG